MPSTDGRVDRFLSKRLNIVFNAMLFLSRLMSRAILRHVRLWWLTHAVSICKRCPQGRARHLRRKLWSLWACKCSPPKGKMEKGLPRRIPGQSIKALPAAARGILQRRIAQREGRKIIHFPCIHHTLYRMFIWSTGSYSSQYLMYLLQLFIIILCLLSCLFKSWGKAKPVPHCLQMWSLTLCILPSCIFKSLMRLNAWPHSLQTCSFSSICLLLICLLKSRALG